MPSNRLLVVSNRLPVTARLSGGSVELVPSSGGLATGLKPWHERSGGLWIGWPGDLSRFSDAQRAETDRRLADSNIVPVPLSRDHVTRYYDGFANRVLWPLFHYLIDRVPVHASGWDAYVQANEAFADATARVYRDGDRIWVHDYQLMLVPALLRQRLPRAAIGFFLHTPFPSSEVFRILPWRREVLAGLLGAHLLGFHTFAYLRHFIASLLHVDGVEVDFDRVVVGDREVQLGVFPMGVDAGAFTQLSQSPTVADAAAAIRRDAGDRQIVLGVDRLDYTKGIPRRLHAIERLLAREPSLADHIRYIQLAVPSRGEVDSYQKFRREVDEIVGHINGAFGSVGSTPVHYMHRSVSQEQLVALYRAADVMLVTPLRDGMNLVAKEFVASQVEPRGVLVLSEFAGAAAELDGALVVNPYDVDSVAGTIHRALEMTPGERDARMKSLRKRVLDHDVHAWARDFIERLASVPVPAPFVVGRSPDLLSVLRQIRQAGPVRVLVDYDGTLVPFARAPELAAPDEGLRQLLRALASAPELELDIVSGRPHETLAAWFGDLRISLWAEHGFWHRPAEGKGWEAAAYVSPAWIARVRQILEQFTASTPGARIEEKSASIAWHYRAVQREFGERQAHELRLLLGDALSNQPLEVLEGKKVIEVRLRGVSKALVAHRIADQRVPGGHIVAIGDDRTDEELFRALPPSAVTIAVGSSPSRARFRLDDYRAVRKVLCQLLDSTEYRQPNTGYRIPNTEYRAPITGRRMTGS